MRALKIESGGSFLIDGELADLTQLENKGEFLSSILTLDAELGNNVNTADLIHFFYDARELIQNILSEEYEVVRALVSGTILPTEYKSIRVYKSFKVESEISENNQEFIYMTPEIELIKSEPGEDGIRNIAGLPIFIDENIVFEHNDIKIESKTKINLLEVLTCLFDELPTLIKSGTLLSQ